MSLFKELPVFDRPREKLLHWGPHILSNTELLALLLRTGTAGKDVITLAQELLDPSSGFQGISGLLNATKTEMSKIKGLGPAKQAEIMAVMELAKRALSEQLQIRPVFDTPATVKQYLQVHLAHKSHEVFAVLFLDAQNRLIALEEMFRGTINQTSVYPREVLIRALHHHSSSLVLAHNHPSGVVKPSRADEQLTQSLKSCLAIVDIKILDHIIVGPGESLSMAESGFI